MCSFHLIMKFPSRVGERAWAACAVWSSEWQLEAVAVVGPQLWMWTQENQIPNSSKPSTHNQGVVEYKT